MLVIIGAVAALLMLTGFAFWQKEQRLFEKLFFVVISFALLSIGIAVSTSYQECPKLENRLYQVAQSSNPERAASERSLYYSQGRVRVVIEMTDPDLPLPSAYSLIVESRYNTLIQALVLPQDMCQLSQESSVRSVRAPSETVPLGKENIR